MNLVIYTCTLAYLLVILQSENSLNINIKPTGHSFFAQGVSYAEERGNNSPGCLKFQIK